MVDLDGVLADMTPFEHILGQPREPSADKWREFFSNADHAPLIDAGRRLVTNICSAGYGYIVSTTRPHWTHRRTMRWIRAQPLPAPVGLYTRSRRHHPYTVTALDTKIDHITQARFIARLDLVTMLYIDDEAKIVTALRGAGAPAELSASIGALQSDELCPLVEEYRQASQRRHYANT